MHAIRSLVIALALAAASTAGAQQPEAIRISLPGHPGVVLLDTLVVTREVEAPLPDAFGMAVKAFEGLRVRPDMNDQARGVVGVTRLTRTGRLGGVVLSRYLNCGEGVTGANADHYRVRMATVVRVEPLGDSRTRVAAAVAAGAEDMTGSGRRVPCTSTRQLEARLLEAIEARS